jgi:hypothetical protein
MEYSAKARGIAFGMKSVLSWAFLIVAFLVSAVNFVLLVRILPDLWLLFILQVLLLASEILAPACIRHFIAKDARDVVGGADLNVDPGLRTAFGSVLLTAALLMLLVGALLHSSIY